MKNEKGGSPTFLDLIGYDVDNSFREPLTYSISQSVNEISIAGQTVSSGNI